MTDIPSRLTAALADRYRIERELGAGGMATVYLAEDLKHERRVALKILRPELAAVIGGDRFLAEIKTTANLQHPHILPLFDSGEADGFLYYVMPFIAGETLRDRLDREGQIGVEEAVRIARDVADALDYAHRNDILHRDIKPANILLHDGRPVVADFGIALAISAAGGGRMTETGLSLGTPHYMSPEQASADRDLSARSDVYSLGCVLYEMLAGQPPHTGPSAQNVLVRILTEDPRNVTELRRTVPTHVAATVMKSIEKLPADRFDTAREFKAALEDPTFAYTPAARAPRVTTAPAHPAASAPGPGGRGSRILPWGVAAVATIVAAWGLLPGPPAPAPVTAVAMAMPEGQEFIERRGPAGNATALSPDGRQLVYTGPDPADPATASILWRRRLDELEATPIAGTEGGFAPEFSRDGRSLAFITAPPMSLHVIPSEGGTAVSIPVFRNVYAWGDDGAIYFMDTERGVLRWNPGEATAERVVEVEEEGGVLFDVLPGSRAGLMVTGAAVVYAVDFETGARHELGPGRHPRYVATGHVVYVRSDDGAMLVQPFDAEGLTTTGPALATPARTATSGFTQGEYALAPDGTLVHAFGASSAGEELVWVDRSGSVQAIDWIEPGNYDGVALSDGADRIVAGWSGGTAGDEVDIWVFDLDSRSRLPLTRDGQSRRPRWHPDGERIAFVGRRDGAPDAPSLFSVLPDGSGQREHIVDFSGGPADAWWTPDGREVLLRMPGVSRRSIFRFAPGESDAPEPWLDRGFNERNPAPSPDGNWLLYVSDQSGRDEVLAQPYPGGGRVVPVSIEGGSQAVWSPDGREVLFVGSDGAMWSASVEYDANRFQVLGRERLFDMPKGVRLDTERPLFDVSPEGRFLMARSPGMQGRGGLVLIRNWVQRVTGKAIP